MNFLVNVDVDSKSDTVLQPIVTWPGSLLSRELKC